MAEAPSSELDGIFSTLAKRHLHTRRVENLGVLSSLLAISARPNADDMKRLVLSHQGKDVFKACCLGAVTSAVNPFIPGMHLMLVLAVAVRQATEGERRPIRDLAKSVKTLLFEIFERLPQTVGDYQRGGGDCSSMLDPDRKGPKDAVDFQGPLSMMLSTRQQRETFCSVPLVTDFLSRTFDLGLPNVMDTEGVLRNVEELNQLSGSGRGGTCVFLVLGDVLAGDLYDAEKARNLLHGRGRLKKEQIELPNPTKRNQPPVEGEVVPQHPPQQRLGALVDPDGGDAHQLNPVRHDVAASSGEVETTANNGHTARESSEQRRVQRVLFGKNRLVDSLRSPRALLQGANYRIHSLSCAPGAQFVLAGLVANPNDYYRVPAMRMALDFVLYVGVLTALGFFLFFQEFTAGVASDDCDEGDCVIDREFGWREGTCATIFVCVSRPPTAVWDTSEGHAVSKFHSLVVPSSLVHSTGLRGLQASYIWARLVPVNYDGGEGAYCYASMCHVDRYIVRDCLTPGGGSPGRLSRMLPP